MDPTREPTHTRCAISACGWCDRDGVECRFCAGTGWWRPERPHRDGNGLVVWHRIDEPCRGCAGTGKEHSPLAVS
ncbi:hypothetical protein NE857_11105 [Nocardiopsis exhalans]|uniref:HNH endonuclease n=1 Tax=Nocardiopsis exhalans TaxID=163604 RepID=A0ABY5DFF4_9ACTN|nr:hypothetical protein [Nocardiopsis exhalans]USY22104.1 hypothetical protein NE857_11105 [Nocardiopsis exhalans]